MALNVTLSNVVDLVIRGGIRYDSRPPDGIRELDVLTKFGIALKIE